MLDFDSLAERCAKTSNEQEEHWRRVLWSADFQKVSGNMSDGEVETMLSHCASAGDFENLVQFLITHPENGPLSPYALMIREAEKAGMSLRDWIKSLTGAA